MNFRIIFTTLLLVATFCTSAEEENRGKEIFTTLCMACHKFDHGPDMIAPPIFGVKNHYLRKYPDREGFIENISSWLEKQDPDKTLMPGAMRRFGVMPPIALEESDRIAIAGFIYDADFSEPSWYAEHYQKEHGTE